MPLPEVRTEVAINDYEQEVGKVAGNVVLEQAFRAVYKVYLVHATLGEMKFSKILPMRRKWTLRIALTSLYLADLGQQPCASTNG